MSYPPPIYPQTQFSFPDHFYHPTEMPQPHPSPSDFFAQSPTNHTGLVNYFNSVSTADAAALSRARLFQFPTMPQQPTSSTTMGNVQPTKETAELIQLLRNIPPEQAGQVVSYLEANGRTSSHHVSHATTAPSTITPHHQTQSAALPSNPSLATQVEPAPNPAGQCFSSTSTGPPANSTSEPPASALPSEKVLGKRKARSDSTSKEEKAAKGKAARKVAKPKTKKGLSDMGQPSAPPAVADVRPASSATLPSVGSISPSSGAKDTTSTPASASGEAPPAKRPKKQRKSKASTQKPEAPVSGIRAMQTVFRADAPISPAPTGMPVIDKYPPPMEQQVETHPSQGLQGETLQANGQFARSETQSNGGPSSQHPASTSASSSVKQHLIPLPMDKQAIYRVTSALRIVGTTGSLRPLYPLLCYRPVQVLLQRVLLTAIQNKWVVRRQDVGKPNNFVPVAGQNPTIQVNNGIGSTPPVGYGDPSDNDNATIRISRNARQIATQFGQGQMQMIPQDVGDGLQTARMPSDDPASNGSDPTPQPDIETRQIPQDTGPSSSRPFDDNGSSAAESSSEGIDTQLGVEAHEVLAEAHDTGCQNPFQPANVGNGMSEPSPFSFAYSGYDFVDITWDDRTSGDIASQAEMAPLYQPSESVDLLGRVGAESTPVNSEGCGPVIAGQVTGNQVPEPSKKKTTASEGTGPVNDAGNDENSSSEFTPAFNDIYQALYGNHDNDSPTLPFRMTFPSTMNIEPTALLETERQDDSSATHAFETSTGHSEFDMEEFFNLDPQN